MNPLIDKLKAVKASGKPVIGCFPLYPPLELLQALDLEPVVLWGLKPFYPRTPKSDQHLQNFVCSVGRHLAEFVLSEASDLVDGLFMYNACDTLRNLPEILQSGLEDAGRAKPIFNIHVPQAPRRQTDAAGYLADEIQNLIETLGRHFGVEFSPSRFRATAEQQNRARTLARELDAETASGRMSFRRLADLMHGNCFRPLDRQIQVMEAALETCRTAEPRTGPGVLLSGIMPPPSSVSSVIEEAGLRVAGNDIASLARSYAHSPDPALPPADYYVDLYYNHFPCSTLLGTADERPAALEALAEERGARGIIFLGEKFCEYEYFEFPHLEKRFKERGLHTLNLEFAIDDDQNPGPVRTRIEAFAELMS